MRKAFTLIEMVVGIGVFAAVILMGTMMMVSTLRASKKAAAVALVRNEGANALGVMTSFIRYADSITSCASTSLVIKTNNQDTVTFTCIVNSSDYYLASNSARLTSVNVKVGNCGIFTCGTNSVGINFSLSKAGTSTLVETTAASTFETTVVLRNK